MKILDGRAVAHTIEDEVKKKIAALPSRPPGLAFVLVGDNPASKAFIKRKKQKCREVGIHSFDREMTSSISEKELTDEIAMLNHNPLIDGILVQLPLPSHINPFAISESIHPEKDVDGFHPLNMGRLLLGERNGFFPCTPFGIVDLLLRSHVVIAGKRVVIVGRSNIVGKPLAALLMQKAPWGNATVTVAHSETRHLEEVCKSAEILIAAMGKAHFITEKMVQEGAIVVDVGINRLEDGRITGDVDFARVAPHTSYISPVPGGVGPMTLALLLSNTFKAYEKTIT